MVIKIRRRDKTNEVIRYKSTKKIISSKDIKEADSFDNALNNEIREIEKILLGKKMISKERKKSDMLGAWYLIGSRINKFLEKNIISPEEEKIFWDQLYGRSSVINKTLPSNKISLTRNDFKTASLLAQQPLSTVGKIKLWALWREVLIYKSFRDKRVFDWVLVKLVQLNPKRRNDARPFLKAVAARLKRIDTSVLTDKELQQKLQEIELYKKSA